MQLSDVNLTAQEIMEMTKKYMIETYQRFPFVATRAKGMHLYDEKRKCISGFLRRDRC